MVKKYFIGLVISLSALYAECGSNFTSLVEPLEFVIKNTNKDVNNYIKTSEDLAKYVNDTPFKKIKLKFKTADEKAKYIKNFIIISKEALKITKQLGINEHYQEAGIIAVELGKCALGITNSVPDSLNTFSNEGISLQSIIDANRELTSTALSCTNVLLGSMKEAFTLAEIIDETLCYNQNILKPMREDTQKLYSERWAKNTSVYFDEYNRVHSEEIILNPFDVDWQWKWNDTKATEEHKLLIAKQIAYCASSGVFAEVEEVTSFEDKLQNTINNYWDNLITQEFKVTCKMSNPNDFFSNLGLNKDAPDTILNGMPTQLNEKQPLKKNTEDTIVEKIFIKNEKKNILLQHSTNAKNNFIVYKEEELTPVPATSNAYITEKFNTTTVNGLDNNQVTENNDEYSTFVEEELTYAIDMELNASEKIEEALNEFNLEYAIYKTRMEGFINSSIKDIDVKQIDFAKLGSVLVSEDGKKIFTEFGDILNKNGIKFDYKYEGSMLDQAGTVVDLAKEFSLISDDFKFNENLLNGNLPDQYGMIALKAIFGNDVTNSYIEQYIPGASSFIAEEIDKLSLIVSANNFTESVSGYIAAAKGTAILLGALDIGSDKDRNNINKAIKYASMAASIYVSVMPPGSLMTAASVLPGLLGGGAGEEDKQAAQRHAEVMQMLGKMDKKLDNIISSLESIDIKIDIIIDMQKEVLLNIENLSKQLDERATEINNNIDLVHQSVLNVQSTLMDVSALSVYINNCATFLNERYSNFQELGQPYFMEDGYDFAYPSFKIGYHENISSIQIDLEHVGEVNYTSCRTYVLNTLYNEDLNRMLLMSSHATEKDDVENVTYYTELINLFKYHYGLNKNIFFSLLNPTLHQMELNNKLFEKLDFNYTSSSYDNIVDSMNKLIHPVAIEYFTHMLLEFFPYKYYINANGTSVRTETEIEELITGSFSAVKKKDEFKIFKNILMYLNLAIAQRNIISGDALIPTMHKKLFSYRLLANKSDSVENTIYILDKNRLLARNYLINQIKKEFKHAGKISGNAESYNNRFNKNLECYRLLYNNESNEACNNSDTIFITRWNQNNNVFKSSLDFINGHISITIVSTGEVIKLKLPKPDEISSNSYYNDPSIINLVRLRDKLYGFILNYFPTYKIEDLYSIQNNYPPISLIGNDYIVQEGRSVSIPKNAYDIENETVTYELLNKPNSGYIYETGSEYIYTPDNSFVGDDNITIVLTDSSKNKKYEVINLKTFKSPPQFLNYSDLYNKDTLADINITLNINKGWNLITLPIDETYDISKIDELFQNAITVWLFKDNTWSVHSKLEEIKSLIETTNYNSISEISSGEGFWINNAVTETVKLSGTIYVINSQDIEGLNSGWHLIGLGEEISTDNVYNFNPNIESIWTYEDGFWNAYSADSELKKTINEKSINTLINIKQAQGFWINIK